VLSGRRVVLSFRERSVVGAPDLRCDVDCGCGVWLSSLPVVLVPAFGVVVEAGDYFADVDEFAVSGPVVVRSLVAAARVSNLVNDARRSWRFSGAVVPGSAYDGDTFSARLVLCVGVELRLVRVRLWGVQAPEMRGPERSLGLAVRDFVRGWLSRFGGSLLVESVSRDKYGRLVARVFSSSGGSLADTLIAARLARPFMQ
jgi:micrococcal nuclease